MYVQALHQLPGKAESSDLDTYVGLVSPIATPFSIYAHLDDLESTHIRFVAYSMGSRRVVAAGVYDESTKSFDLDAACVTQLNTIAFLLRDLPKRRFIYTSDVATNRIDQIRLELIHGNRIPFADYQLAKYAVGVLEGTVRDSPELLELTGVDPIDWMLRNTPDLSKSDLLDVRGDLSLHPYLGRAALRELTELFDYQLSIISRYQRFPLDGPEYKYLKYVLAYLDGKITEDQFLGAYPTGFQFFDSQFLTENLLLPSDELEDPIAYGEKYEQFIANQRDRLEEYEQSVNLLSMNRDIPKSAHQKLMTMSQDFENFIVTKGWARSANLPPCPSQGDCMVEEGEESPNQLCRIYTIGAPTSPFAEWPPPEPNLS